MLCFTYMLITRGAWSRPLPSCTLRIGSLHIILNAGDKFLFAIPPTVSRLVRSLKLDPKAIQKPVPLTPQQQDSLVEQLWPLTQAEFLAPTALPHRGNQPLPRQSHIMLLKVARAPSSVTLPSPSRRTRHLPPPRRWPAPVNPGNPFLTDPAPRKARRRQEKIRSAWNTLN